MTKFTTVTAQMFKQKSKYVYLTLIVQVIATAVFTWMNQGGYVGFRDTLYGTSMFLTVMFDVIFLALMCWQNEKINLSQTWRQIPISSSKFYLSNIMSTLLNCAYLFVIQILINVIITLPKVNEVFDDFFGFADYTGNYWVRGLIFGIFLVLIVVMITTFVSFTNFLTRIIIDFLPVKNTLWVKMLVMGILIIIAAYIGMQINDHFTNFLMTKVAGNMATQPNVREVGSLQVTDIEFAIISLVLGSFDLWFMNRFVEAKIQK